MGGVGKTTKAKQVAKAAKEESCSMNLWAVNIQTCVPGVAMKEGDVDGRGGKESEGMGLNESVIASGSSERMELGSGYSRRMSPRRVRRRE